VSAAPAPGAARRRIPAAALLFLAWLLGGIALIYWGLFSLPFFVSHSCGRLLMFPAIGYGLAVATAWVLAMLRQPAQLTTVQRLLQLGLIPLVFAWIAYESLSSFLPSALNAATGAAYSRAYTVAAVVHDSGSDRCNHITLRELDPSASFLLVCVSQATIDSIQPGAKVWLNGKESWFGLSVSSYAYHAQP
jgi:hypothetical protein